MVVDVGPVLIRRRVFVPWHYLWIPACRDTVGDMSTWRPKPEIRVKALGLHWRDERLLAAEVYRDDGSVKGVRPLGGSIEFGEPAEVALRREFKEELGVNVEVLGGPILMENLYFHEGVTGHEVLFIFEVDLPPAAFNNRDYITFQESDGTLCTERWYDLDLLDQAGGLELYPAGLKTLLTTPPGARSSDQEG